MAYPTKPTVSKPEWATDVGAIKTEPSAPRKQTGWGYIPGTLKGEKPIMDYINWNTFVTGVWITWAENALDDIDARISNKKILTVSTMFTTGW